MAEPTVVAPGGGVRVQADLLVPGPMELALVRSDGLRVIAGTVDDVDQGHFDALLSILTDLPVSGHGP